MRGISRRIRLGLPAIAVLAASCAGPYDKPSTSTYIIGAIFLLLGIYLAYELIKSTD